MDIYLYLWYVIVYAFLGWCVEVTYAGIRQKKFVNRGFLSGPVCPIYGFGVAIVAYILGPVKDTIIPLFFASAAVVSLLEFLTGLVLEKLFSHKWWDYSDRKFNLMGYICLEFSLLWGVACVVVMRLILPLTDKIILLMPKAVGITLLSVFWAILVADVVCTTFAVRGLNKQIKILDTVSMYLKSDSDKIGQKVFEKTSDMYDKYAETAKNMNVLMRRLLDAFPNMKSEGNGDEHIKQIRKYIAVNRQRIKDLKKKK